ncbi:MAG: WbqC-like protein family protein [bacterium ADurb.Bin236]|nr:MAG: WbqC-like protein family protein [bacterium ADurb.Bin236]HOY64779.1 WbqC family protein [bacterium]HPN94871.1 WbqC family protein [bacterium]
MIVSVHQPHYLPWLGYFDKIAASDLFVLLDNVQYKKREYQNRNRIRTRQGVKWLTVPVATTGKYEQMTGEVEIESGASWREKHLETLRHAYSSAPHFKRVFEELEELYMGREWARLAEINSAMLAWFMKEMEIETRVALESELGTGGLSTERIVNICRAVGADVYLSGSGGRDYMDEALFEKAGLKLEYQKYEHPVYPQVHGGFEPFMGIVDLLFNAGKNAAQIVRSGRR